MHNIYLCNLCETSLNHRSSMKFNLCQTMSHPKCKDLNYIEGRCLDSKNIWWYCRAFCADIFPFTNTNNYRLYLSINNTEKILWNWSKRNMSCIKTPEKQVISSMNLIISLTKIKIQTVSRSASALT